MREIVTTYLLKDPETPLPMRRDAFYAEQINYARKGKSPVRAVGVVNVYIFNLRKELLVQKRSFRKSHNPGLLDKSIGGHISYGNTADYTVMVETVQELQTPSIVLRSDDEFKKTFKLLSGYLSTIAIIRHLEDTVCILDRMIDNKIVKIANKVHLYVGAYDGRIRPADREAKGILHYSLTDLAREVKRFPDAFTYDLRLFLKKPHPEVKSFLNFISKR